jgi:hypothetical protein
MSNVTACKTGFYAATLSIVFSIGYSIPQLLSAFKIIPHPQDLFWLFLPSLFLAPAFVVTTICLHYCADAELRLWTAIAVAFALLYCADVSLVYFTQLAVIVPAELKGELNGKQVLLFDNKSFLMAIDCLGYFFMSLSTFFAAFAFKENKRLYRFLLLHGCLMPILVLAFFYPLFFYLGALWMITFPLAMIQTVKFFNTTLHTRFKTIIV